jgi:methionyl-tRNA formyltransferase
MTVQENLGEQQTSYEVKSLRIEFLTDDNPLYVLPFFEEFLAKYGDELPIARISLCAPMGKRSRRDLFERLTALYGRFGMLRIMARLVHSRLMSLLPRRRGVKRYFSMTQLAKAYGIPCERIDSPNDETFRSAMIARAPDVVVSVACPFILKAPVLAIPRLGCINIHHAPLPRYKGMMPTFWQVFNRETSVGVTIHYMNEAIDEGNGLLQEQMEIQPGETLDHLIKRSKRHGAHCMARVLRQLRTGEQTPFPLGREASTYFSFPTAEQMLDFRKQGFRVL